MTKTVRNFDKCTAGSILDLNEAAKLVRARIKKPDESDRKAEDRARNWLRKTWAGAQAFRLGEVIDRALKKNDEWRVAFETCPGKWRDPAKAVLTATLGEMTVKSEAHQELHTFEQSKAALDDALMRLASKEAQVLALRSEVARYKKEESERTAYSESQSKKAKRKRKM